MTSPARTDALAHTLADRACIADIQTNCHLRHDSMARAWWNTQPMLDPNEQPAQCIDMNAQALEYAEARGLIVRDPTQPHMVRIVRDTP
jgi:hypothetical protein